MNLTEISRTAFLPLICRTLESEKKNPILNDPMASVCLERLTALASEEEKQRINKWKKIYVGTHVMEARASARRSKTYDNIASRYISDHPGCKLINLACGFDTRYWRIEHEKCQYIELDLPEMIELKREILKDHLEYELIGCSILEPAWIDQITANGNSNFVLLAEALFMYLPHDDGVRILQEIARRFNRSQLVLDMVPEKYTRGLWKWLLGLESRAWGLDVSLKFGIRKPRDIEAFGNSFKVIDVTKGSIGPIITVSIDDA